MFEMNSKKKEMREGLLEKLIDHMMMLSDEEKAEEGDLSEVVEGEEKPKAEVKVMELEMKPKAKFKMPDGSEQEDESLEEILARKKKEKLGV